MCGNICSNWCKFARLLNGVVSTALGAEEEGVKVGVVPVLSARSVLVVERPPGVTNQKTADKTVRIIIIT